MSKPLLRIDFADFGNFDKNDNLFVRFLSTRFDVRITDEPDVLIYSDFGHRHRLYATKKVYYTNESTPADFAGGQCDYALTSFPSDGERNFRLPYYALLGDPAKLIKERTPEEVERIAARQTEFCAFVVSQDHGRKTANRINFFHRLSKYKKVNSGGRILNNVGGPLGPTREDKLSFLRKHKFMIAFENGNHPGYVTEKIYDAMEARCIPIYWGTPEVVKDFNPESFINASSFRTPDMAVARIIEVDNDPELYHKMLAAPFFHGNVPNVAFDPVPLCEFFEKIVTDPHPPVSAGKKGLFGRWTLAKRDKYAPRGN
ncbi:Glycosyltransferase family 10 (fucosyltransferase) C-term [Verrucomicrobium sp. GAS474]|uniref:glycosyltransferase family 10 domain-containing protein n=1 Tax=Verrucomicrobium sp. GAS474 TaxID=1882831 RepID=UPI00087A8029|nr:glycosyltransferase family 10 [Verrucomicrobium sp. GAS474]SDU10412.1 Glycosyltransferase family 10 (fucosyltransferase) C-term [Verrucomicrobium sp. GAS474]